MPTPKILSTKTCAHSKWFQIETVTVAYDNQLTAELERIQTPLKQAVIIAPILNDQFILANEYMVGNEQMGLTFPKGKVDPGETPEQAAIREMREEIGYTANTLHLLKVVDSMPGYIQHETHLFVATDLYAAPLDTGDEAEPLVSTHWPINDHLGLLHHPQFTDARNVATLLLTATHFTQSKGPSERCLP